MKDFMGVEIEIGDRVICASQHSTGDRFKTAYVDSFTKKMVRVCYTIGGNDYLRSPNQLIVYKDPKPITKNNDLVFVSYDDGIVNDSGIFHREFVKIAIDTMTKSRFIEVLSRYYLDEQSDEEFVSSFKIKDITQEECEVLKSTMNKIENGYSSSRLFDSIFKINKLGDFYFEGHEMEDMMSEENVEKTIEEYENKLKLYSI